MSRVEPSGVARVLVVDDDADSREVTAAFLRASGFVVEEFESAEAAMPLVNGASAIVTDITLPGMSGYEFAAALRADARTKSVVLFALSGRSDASPQQAKLFDRIVVKPFDPEALVRALQTSTNGSVDTVSSGSFRVSASPVPPTKPSLSASHYRLLVEHSPTLVWRTDLEGRCDYFNETWLAFTGRVIEQELGDGWMSIIHPDDLERTAETYRQNFERRIPFEMEYRLRRHDGVFRTLLSRGIPLFDETSRFRGFMGSSIDVDERAEADRAKAMFLGMMAHEMRTPLTPLRAYQVQMQRAQAKGEPISEDLVKRFARQIDRLAGLVEHLGDAARLSTNRRLSVAREPQDFCAIVQRATEKHQQALAARRESKHTPTLEVVGLDHECPVIGDKKRLEQLAHAIVDNAVKFSPMGGAIRVSLASDNGEHRLVVTDSGTGIPPEKLSAVGRPYFRASNAPPDNYPGLGLGLAVAKEITQALGGSLVVETGRGVRVTVRLPALQEGNSP